MKNVNDFYPMETLEEKSTISKIVAFVKDLSVSPEKKSLRKAGLVDSNFNWTDDAKDIVLSLVASDRNYDSYEDMKKDNGGTQPSTLEMEGLFADYYENLVKFANDFNHENDKKRK